MSSKKDDMRMNNFSILFLMMIVSSAMNTGCNNAETDSTGSVAQNDGPVFPDRRNFQDTIYWNLARCIRPVRYIDFQQLPINRTKID